jgi:Clostripain family
MTRPEWTFMVYMAGDNNLSDAGDRDLAEMRTVGSTDEVNIVVEFDNAGDHGTRRFRIEKDGLDERVEHLGETDCGDPATVIDFLKWAAREYPANRYALVLWNHGSGWVPTDLDRIARGVNSPSYSPGEVSERSSSPLGRVMFRSTQEKIFGLPDASVRAICSDDGSGHSLDMIELEKVLTQGVESLGQQLNLLGMDACLMSNIEVAYQVRNLTQWVVASEENEPNNGWPYDRVLQRLVANPHAPTKELAAGIVTDYIQSYLDVGFTGDVTQAALETGRITRVSSTMAELARRLTAHMPNAADEIWRAQRRSTHFCQATLWDIREFCDQLASSSASLNVREAAAAVVVEIDRRPDGFVIEEDQSGAGVDDCGGVSVYLVSPLKPISRYYADLAWAKDVSPWLDMLRRYHEA